MEISEKEFYAIEERVNKVLRDVNIIFRSIKDTNVLDWSPANESRLLDDIDSLRDIKNLLDRIKKDSNLPDLEKDDDYFDDYDKQQSEISEVIEFLSYYDKFRKRRKKR